jgi:hypothetical protein
MSKVYAENTRSTNSVVAEAVKSFWKTRADQSSQQHLAGKKDQGDRGAVTGGAQMDGFIRLITTILINSGCPEESIYHRKKLELPGYFRPTKEWDILVIHRGQLVLAIETKSQVGPSFGNNFNNRTEEAMGSALDLWTAYREGAFSSTFRPWLGYLFLLEDCAESRRPVKVQEPHFKVFPEFIDASYAKRYELFCRKLVRERHYDVTTFLLADRIQGMSGQYSEPADDLRFEIFHRSMVAHLTAFAKEL